jgi:hypothetical protein
MIDILGLAAIGVAAFVATNIAKLRNLEYNPHCSM